FGHVDRIVEDHNPAVPNETVVRRKDLVIVSHIEHRAWEIGAKRAAALDRPHRPAGKRPPAGSVHNLAKCEAEPGLIKTAIADISGDLDRHRPARTPKPEPGIETGAAVKDGRHRRQ